MCKSQHQLFSTFVYIIYRPIFGFLFKIYLRWEIKPIVFLLLRIWRRRRRGRWRRRIWRWTRIWPRTTIGTISSELTCNVNNVPIIACHHTRSFLWAVLVMFTWHFFIHDTSVTNSVTIELTLWAPFKLYRLYTSDSDVCQKCNLII